MGFSPSSLYSTSLYKKTLCFLLKDLKVIGWFQVNDPFFVSRANINQYYYLLG